DTLCGMLDEGAAAVLLTEEALTLQAAACLRAALEGQPPWSDLPLVVLTSGGETTPGSMRMLDRLGPSANATLLERPLRAVTLVSAVRAALRTRRHQYRVREHLEARARGEAGARFLAAASAALSASLEDEAALQRVADLAIAQVADFCC